MDHWYTREGKPCHTQKTKAGAKNAERPTNIKDARSQKLLPSVSTILKLFHVPQLERWKQSKIVEACYNRPPIGDESLEGYEGFILSKAFEETDKAASLGTQIHANIEAILKNEVPPHADSVQFALDAIAKVDELGLEVAESEVVVINTKHGYAGTTDLAVKRKGMFGIVDFKSTRTTKDEPVLRKFGHAAQIAAYHVGYWSRIDFDIVDSVGYNIYISTTEPGRIDVVKYDNNELKKEWKFFMDACSIWRYKNDYDPRS
jgi:hypothetical protein